jgi:hypothetical protein
MGRTALLDKKFREGWKFLWGAVYRCRKAASISATLDLLGFRDMGAAVLWLYSRRGVQVVENTGWQVKGDEEGKSWRYGRSTGDSGSAGKFAGGQPAAMGENERAPGGMSPVRFVSRSNGRPNAVGEAHVDWQAGEMGGAGLTIDVDARHADDARSGSDETWDQAGGVCGGCERIATAGGAILDGAARFYLEAASVFRRDERAGLDEVGLVAYGSSFEAVRGLKNGNWKMENSNWRSGALLSTSD